MELNKLFGYHFAINTDLKNRIFSEWRTTKTKQLLENGGTQEEADALDFTESQNLILNTDVKHYYISKPVLEFAKQIKLKDTTDFQWLLPIKDQFSQYSFENSFIIFNKTGSRLVAMASTRYDLGNDQQYLHWNMFNIDLENAVLSADSSEYGKNFYNLLLQLLSFIELSEIEEITIKPKAQHGFGTKKDPNTIHNGFNFPITLVNSRWVQRVYRPGEFMVVGHQRWQPKGPGRSHYELIWIDPYVKKGITITAGKERNS